MSKFKVGDKVRVVDAEDLGPVLKKAMVGKETEIVSEHYLINHWFILNKDHELPVKELAVHESCLKLITATTPPSESITYQVNGLTIIMSKGKLIIDGKELNIGQAEALTELIREFVKGEDVSG